MKTINILLVSIILIFILLIGYWAVTPTTAPLWTGFGPYDETTQGARSKTLWDWLDLLVVPIFLAIGGYLLSWVQKEAEKNIELDRQRQNILSSFVNQISTLLLEKKLRTAKINSEIRSVARAFTQTAIRNLDGNRKASVLQFLSESKLISIDPIISLLGTDLTESHLRNATLRGVEIKGAHFSNSDFKDANLSQSNFSCCDFTNSVFNGATLEETDFSYAILKGVKFRNVNLTKTNLDWANLEEADLTNALIIKDQLQKLEFVHKAKLLQPVNSKQ